MFCGIELRKKMLSFFHGTKKLRERKRGRTKKVLKWYNVLRKKLVLFRSTYLVSENCYVKSMKG